MRLGLHKLHLISDGFLTAGIELRGSCEFSDAPHVAVNVVESVDDAEVQLAPLEALGSTGSTTHRDDDGYGSE